MADLSAYSVVPQSYGMQCAQVTFGGPRGVWLDCSGPCRGGGRVVGPDPHSLTDAEAVAVLRAAGWTGEGDKMKGALCPGCQA